MDFLAVDDLHSSIFPLLSSLNIQVNYQPAIQREEILSIIGEYEGLIIRSKTFINREFLEKANRLKLIARAGSGMDIIDVQAAAQKNIYLLNAAEGNKDAVAEHIIGMLLMLFNNLKQADDQLRHYIWQREANRGLEIKGKVFSIIGYGNVGKALARRLSGFECKVLAFDRKLKGYGDQYVTEASMEEIFEHTNILSINTSLNDQTRNLITSSYLNSFQKNIYLINTARGEILNLADLKEALENGKVSGACLDVLENEKLHTLTPAQKEVFDYLTASKKVILTPHVAGWTFESYQRINKVLTEKIEQWLRQYIYS